MASYRIVLNLTGNAVSRSERLADNLWRANEIAKRLSSNMAKIRGPIGGFGGGFGGNGTSGVPHHTAYSNLFAARTTLSTQSGLGTVFTFGAKLNAILAVVDVVGAIAKKLSQISISGTALSYGMGYKAINFAADVLTSSQMGEGIRLLQRRQQARLGFGESFAEAQERAMATAAGYGLDPANVLASMNVLTGMGLGRTGRKLTVQEAERLTLAGGLISQQSGASFERVMTNIQQMMSQTVPSLRDIREMLNAAPILSKYAMQELEKQGLQGVSPMDWLKNQANIATVLERYLSENPALLSMQARGIAQYARTNMYATLAENPAWYTVATKYQGLMETLGKSFSILLSEAANSTALSESLYRFTSLLENGPEIISKFTEKLDGLVNTAAKFLGIDLAGSEGRAAREAEAEANIRKYLTINESSLRGLASNLGVSENAPTNVLVAKAMGILRRGGGFSGFVDYDTYSGAVGDDLSFSERLRYLRGLGWEPSGALSAGRAGHSKSWFVNELIQASRANIAKQPLGGPLFTSNLSDAFAGQIKTADIFAALGRQQADTTGPLKITGTPTEYDDISGYGRGTRALIINFNDAIVKLEQNITSDDPSEVMTEVEGNIESAASRAIQIALLGATSKLGQSF